MDASIAATWDRYQTFETLMDAAESGDMATVNSLLGDPAVKDHLENDPTAERDLVSGLANSRLPEMFEIAMNRLAAKPELVHVRGAQSATLLHDAAGVWNVGFAERLIAQGSDLNAKAAFNHTPLYYASNHSEPSAMDREAMGAAFVEMLLQSGAFVNPVSGPNRCTPLHMAARRGSLKIAESLLRHGANIEAVDIKGETPLRRAINCRKQPMVELLLAHGANPDRPDRYGKTPRQAAKGIRAGK